MTQQPSSNVAHAEAPAATAAATKASKSGSGIRILTGTGTILVAAGAGGMVGRKIIEDRRSKQDNEVNGSSIDDDANENVIDDQPIQQVDLELAKLKMTDAEQEAAEAAAQEAQEKTQAMVAIMLNRVKEAELRASEMLEDTTKSEPEPPHTSLPPRPVPVPITNDVEPKKSESQAPVPHTPLPSRPVPVPITNDVEPKKSVEPEPTPTDGVVDAVVAEVMSPLVEPTPVSSDGKTCGPSSTGDSPVSLSPSNTASIAAAAALAASVTGAPGATVTDSATDDLIAKYFVYPSDPAPAVQAKPNVSWKDRLTYGNKSRDTSGLRAIVSSTQNKSTVVAAPMETKDFDALDLITQQSFLEQIRDESVDMMKAKRADENLELSAVESKGVAMAAGRRAKLDTQVTSKKAKNQNDKTKPGFGKTKRAIGSL